MIIGGTGIMIKQNEVQQIIQKNLVYLKFVYRLK